MHSKTLSPENQFRFKCPVFNAETKIASCFALRDAVARGDRVDVRQGCQVAMHSSKCPIPFILKRMVREGSDDYHATDATLRKLRDVDLDKVAPVLVLKSEMDRFALNSKEQQALLQANDLARHRAGHATSKPHHTKSSHAVKKDKTIEAATTGDLSAAINAETTHG
jgi:hypothetical protein